MVKIPRQFETFLDVGLQGFAPGLYWGVFTVCSQATSCIPWMYVIKKSQGKVTTFVPPPKFKSHFIYSWFKTSFKRLHFLSFTSQVFQ